MALNHDGLFYYGSSIQEQGLYLRERILFIFSWNIDDYQDDILDHLRLSNPLPGKDFICLGRHRPYW